MQCLPEASSTFSPSRVVQKMSYVEQRKQEFRSYAEAQLRPILEKMVEKAMISLPEDPIEFMVTFLQQHQNKSAADVLKANKENALGGEKDAEITRLSERVNALEMENNQLKQKAESSVANSGESNLQARIEELEAENAALKKEIESLKSAIPSSSESPAHPETAETAPPTTGEDAEANKGEALAAKLKSNRAVYIVGETAEKPKVVSDAIKTLGDSGTAVELVDVTITSRSHEFYGKWNDNGEWEDSAFTAALRKFQDDGEKAEGLQILYLKGDVTLFIAEDLKNQVATQNELLIPDDTKISIPNTVRVIVEVGEHAPNEESSKCANLILPNDVEDDDEE